MKRMKISLVVLALVCGAASAFTTTKTYTPNCPLTGGATEDICQVPGDAVCCIATTTIVVRGVTYGPTAPAGNIVPGTYTP